MLDYIEMQMRKTNREKGLLLITYETTVVKPNPKESNWQTNFDTQPKAAVTVMHWF